MPLRDKHLQKMRRKEYLREYYKRNKARIKGQAIDYYNDNREVVLERFKKYYAENREKCMEISRKTNKRIGSSGVSYLYNLLLAEARKYKD